MYDILYASYLRHMVYKIYGKYFIYKVINTIENIWKYIYISYLSLKNS